MGKNNRPYPFRVALGGLLAVATVDQSLASDPRMNQSADRVIEEVVVTATHRKVQLQDIAVSVSALDGDVLQTMGAREYQDYILSTPGISFTDAGGRNREFVIRGIPDLGQSPTTAFYIDETPITFDPRLYDIERVEVLRGPQGTLFGASSMGGAIRTITIKPDTENFSGFAELGVAGTRQGGESPSVAGALNIPILENELALRLVGYWERESGIIDNYSATALATSFPLSYVPGSRVSEDPNDHEISGMRAALAWTPGESWSVTANVLLQKDRFLGVDNEDTSIFGEESFRQFRPLAEVAEDENQIFNITIEKDFQSGVATLSSSHEWHDVINTIDATQVFRGASLLGGPVAALGPIANTPEDALSAAYISQDNTRWTTEARFVSSLAGPLQFTLGAYYSDYEVVETQDLRMAGLGSFTATSQFADSLDATFFTAVGLPPLGAVFQPGLADASVSDSLDLFIADSQLKELSFYGELSYQIRSDLELTVGLRRYDIDQSVTTSDTGFFATFGECIGNLGAILFEGAACEQAAPVLSNLDSDETGTTYKLNVAYRPLDSVLIYTTLSSGYRPGGANSAISPTEQPPTGLSEIPSAYESDSLDQIELGWRGQFLQQRLTLNGSIYHIDWDNIQTLLNTTPSGVLFTANVGRATSKGIELETQFKISDALSLNVVYSYTDATFSENFAGVISKGDLIPNIPKASGLLALQYDVSTRLYTRAELLHVGERKETAEDLDPLDSYQLLHLRAGYDWDQWRLKAYLENVTDERVILGDSTNFASGIRRVHYTLPRTLGLSVSYQF